MEKKYLTGFSSQENETSIDELPVEGRIPSWLVGSLVRTGPSKFEVGQSQYRHWFDGLAMLHKFSFTRQKIGYTCKFLESDAYLQARQKKRSFTASLAQIPARIFSSAFLPSSMALKPQTTAA